MAKSSITSWCPTHFAGRIQTNIVRVLGVIIEIRGHFLQFEHSFQIIGIKQFLFDNERKSIELFVIPVTLPANHWRCATHSTHQCHQPSHSCSYPLAYAVATRLQYWNNPMRSPRPDKHPYYHFLRRKTCSNRLADHPNQLFQNEIQLAYNSIQYEYH